MERAYTSGEVASFCAVNKTTVARWVGDGVIQAFRTPGGHRRILLSDLRRFMAQYGIPERLGNMEPEPETMVDAAGTEQAAEGSGSRSSRRPGRRRAARGNRSRAKSGKRKPRMDRRKSLIHEGKSRS